MDTVTGRLEHRIETGQLQHDPAQIEAAAALDDLLQRLAGAPKGGWFRKPQPVRGLYMWGGVGRGKSMLMDSFYALSPLPAWRVHFHEFMGRVHDKLTKARARSDVSDPIPPVAKELADGIRVLCFDEFQVTQIADAMILSRLFEHLFELRVTVVATSNRPPDDLYKNGLNRELFTPFIDLLKTKCDVLELAANRDYRLERLSEAPVWHISPAEAALDRAFERLTLGAEPQSCELSVQGRTLNVPREAAGVARFTFEELCARPLGARDYLTLAATFHTLILEDIPRLSPENRNEAARFVALIDALYESRVKLVASAATEPEQLYVHGTGSFEFQRTASRLHEMRSTEYMAEEHKIPDLI
ncbi:MAG: cell division protein ZapE [Pseudomonadota bacterium]